MDSISMSAKEITEAIKSKKLSALEVTLMHIDRMEKVNPKINAVVETCKKEAIDTAKKIDDRISKKDQVGLLCGVPVTIKIVADQKGFVTSFGLCALKNNIATEDNPVVSNFRNADAIIIGRTNSPAFATRWFTDNNLYGQTLNPVNTTITPGGSSGGASASVAAGIGTIAHATDIAGSIRYPAYACGVHGLRPSIGRIPFYNPSLKDRFIGAQLMAVSGPIARNISDLELSFRAMSSLNGLDPWQVITSYTPPQYEKKAALTIAPDGLDVSNEVVNELNSAAEKLRDCGWTVEETDCPPIRQAADINAFLWLADSQHAQSELIETEAEPNSKFVFEQMSKISGQVSFANIMDALQIRVGLMRQWDLFLREYSVLICTISANLPFEQQQDVLSVSSFAKIYESQLTQRALPVLGVPVLAVATGKIKGVPIGVQLVGARYREDIVLQAGIDLEKNIPKIEICEPD